ncbi:MAG: hypothetical protein K8F91_07495, partial [Candidatus Obscuribacterales bacterium]|nr:hypothetical protein [Candidatus Obscuribacterales bacterium]
LPETIIYMISYPWLLFLVSVLVDAAVVFAIGKGMPRVLFVKSYLVAIVAALIIQIATLVGSFVAIFLLSALMSIGG